MFYENQRDYTLECLVADLLCQNVSKGKVIFVS